MKLTSAVSLDPRNPRPHTFTCGYIPCFDKGPRKIDREKVGNVVMDREVRQGKMKYLKILFRRVASQQGNIQHQKVLTS